MQLRTLFIQFFYHVKQRTVQRPDDALADQAHRDGSCQRDTHADPLISHKELLCNHQCGDAAKQCGIHQAVESN